MHSIFMKFRHRFYLYLQDKIHKRRIHHTRVYLKANFLKTFRIRLYVFQQKQFSLAEQKKTK